MDKTLNHNYFVKPKFLVGDRALEHIHIELDGYNASRPMVIASKDEKSNVKTFIRALADSNVTVGALVDDVLPYVNMAEVKRLAGLYQWRLCDSIIALGGESAMDIAKTLNLFVNNIKISNPLEGHTSMSPMVYIATSKVNGFEVSNSVNIDGKMLQSDILYPDIVCIDGRLISITKNFSNIIYTAFNSLAECIEGAETTQKNPFVDASAFSAIRLIVESLKIIAKSPKDKNASLGLMNGIALAGTISSNAQSEICCLTAQFLAKETELPQGLFAGFLLAHSIQFKIDEKFLLRDELLLAVAGIDEFCAVPKEQRLFKAIAEIDSLVKSFSKLFPRDLAEVNFQKYLLASISQDISSESNGRISPDFANKFLDKVFSSNLMN